MNPGRLKLKLFGFLAVVLVLVGITLVQGKEPLLGLDLQGGISVTLEPVGNVREGSLDVALDVIRSNVDSLGVAEPEINRQGPFIVCDLPGVENRDEARRLCSSVEELRFRPVIANLPPAGQARAGSSSTTTTTTPSDPTTTTVPAEGATPRELVAACDVNGVLALDRIPTTSRADDKRDSCVVLPLRSTDDNQSPGRLLLGPTELTGKDVDQAKREFAQGQGYTVRLDLTSDGLAKFNDLAAKSFGQPTPQDQVAIVLGRVVQSNPAFQESNFSGSVQISGNFGGGEASDLAKQINYGTLRSSCASSRCKTCRPRSGRTSCGPASSPASSG
jgi:preprotein translocase subunit SecD